MKTIQEALEFIHGASKFGIKLGLSGIQEILDGINNPEKKLKFIHIAGTNGKGSVSTFISQSLLEEGYNVGKYTSPHISSFNERINLNGEDISDEDLIKSTSEVKKTVDKLRLLEKYPTEFEIITAIAFDYFAKKQVDVVVLETGLGGRLDSTNVVTPVLSVISKVALDHTDRLGETISEIAYEKAGIIKKNVPVCVGIQEKLVSDVIREKAKELSSELFELNESDIEELSLSLDKSLFKYKGKSYEISMLGKYQLYNASLAIMSLDVLNEKTEFKISFSSIKKGLKNAKWQARFELLQKRPILIADGAHNLNGISALKDSLKKYFGDRKLKAVFAVMKDKDVSSMLEQITDVFDEFYLFTANVERAMDKAEISKILENNNYKGKIKLMNSVEDFQEQLDEKEVYIAFGSLYFIAEFKELYADKEKVKKM